MKGNTSSLGKTNKTIFRKSVTIPKIWPLIYNLRVLWVPLLRTDLCSEQKAARVTNCALPSSVWWKDYNARLKVRSAGFRACKTSPSSSKQALSCYTNDMPLDEHSCNCCEIRMLLKKPMRLTNKLSLIFYILYIFCHGPEEMNLLWFTIRIND